MRKKSRISFGPGAASIILILVILTMSVLGILSLISARSSVSLAERSAEVTEEVYRLDVQAEEAYAALDALVADAAKEGGSREEILARIAERLPEKMTIEDNLVSWVETDGARELVLEAAVSTEKGESRLRWTAHRLTAQAGDDVWN